MVRSLAALASLALASTLDANLEDGAQTYARFCASCHGPEGAGLLGPNLTDDEVLHGESLADIKRVVAEGIQGKSMPAWSPALSDEQIHNVSLFVQSIMGRDLVGPNQRRESTVTPFPEGTPDRPLLIRTFMPALELPDAVFRHHGVGEQVPRYSPRDATVNRQRIDPTIDGVPGAIAVNFGPQLSYCFDSTECRLLYTWSGPFLDMTNYWGAGEGGGRQSFGYLAELIGPVHFQASVAPLFPGEPTFRGYRKIDSVPQFEYTVGDLEVSLLIEPGEQPGEAVCRYRTNAQSQLRLPLPPTDAVAIGFDRGSLASASNTLYLSAEEAQAFTLTLTPVAAAQ